MSRVADSFTSVMGHVVCFVVYPARNTTVPPTDEHQVFHARIQALGDGVAVLDSVDICFLVAAF